MKPSKLGEAKLLVSFKHVEIIGINDDGTYQVQDFKTSDDSVATETDFAIGQTCSVSYELLESLQHVLSEFAIATKDGRSPNQQAIYEAAIAAIQRAKGEII